MCLSSNPDSTRSHRPSESLCLGARSALLDRGPPTITSVFVGNLRLTWHLPPPNGLRHGRHFPFPSACLGEVFRWPFNKEIRLFIPLYHRHKYLLSKDARDWTPCGRLFPNPPSGSLAIPCAPTTKIPPSIRTAPQSTRTMRGATTGEL